MSDVAIDSAATAGVPDDGVVAATPDATTAGPELVSTAATSDVPPDRLAVDARSRYHDAAVLERGVGVRFNDVEKTTVEEYCVSEGWIRVAVGKARDRHGNPSLLTLKGRVEPYFLDSAGPPTRGPADPALR